jgi:hypothetical protein
MGWIIVVANLLPPRGEPHTPTADALRTHYLINTDEQNLSRLINQHTQIANNKRADMGHRFRLPS